MAKSASRERSRPAWWFGAGRTGGEKVEQVVVGDRRVEESRDEEGGEAVDEVEAGRGGCSRGVSSRVEMSFSLRSTEASNKASTTPREQYRARSAV